MRLRRWPLPFGVGITFVLALVGGAAEAESRQAREERRAVEWKVAEMFQALAVHPGARLADIGAGDGFLTLRLAPAVGPAGKVFAVDIDDHALGELGKRVRSLGLGNVSIVHGQAEDPLLATGSLDGAVVLRSYHEFTHYREMLAKIHAALRPGSRLVIADVGPSSWNRDSSRDSQCAAHVLASALVERELTEAGFRVLARTDPYAQLSHGETAWLVTAERP